MSGMTELVDRYRAMATEDLASAYRDLGGLVRAVEAQRLAMLAVLEERDAYRLDGCLDAAQWVAATDVVTTATAKAAVDTARALTELPAITEVAAAGGLSMAQLVPLAEIAEPSSDERWAKEGPGASPAALAELARQQRRVRREDAQRQQGRRSFRWWKDRHGAGTRFAGLLPDDAAAVVTEAVTRRAEEMKPDDQGVYDPYESRCADALVELASGDSAEAGRPEVVVVVPLGVDREVPTLDDGTPIALDVVRRLACDATARLLVENPDGTVAGYGRRRRIVPDKLRQRLRRRDRGCRWHGCGRTRGLRAHHVRHWADGGETDEGNCILLCHRHHVLLHDGGWTVTGEPSGTLTFHRPANGAALPNTLPAARPDLLRRYGLDAA
jgi:hypothetical protein